MAGALDVPIFRGQPAPGGILSQMDVQPPADGVTDVSVFDLNKTGPLNSPVIKANPATTQAVQGVDVTAQPQTATPSRVPFFTRLRQSDSNSSLEEMPSRLGDVVGAEFGGAFSSGPSRAIYDVGRHLIGLDQKGVTVPADQARLKIKAAGVDLTVPDTGIASDALDSLIANKKDEKVRADVLNRAPPGFVPGSLRVAASLAGSIADPLNLAVSLVPFVGEARAATLIAGAGSAAGRLGVRAAIGAAQGAAGQALLEPIEALAAYERQDTYTLADSIRNIGVSGLLGGALHAGGGLVADIRGGAPRLALNAEGKRILVRGALPPGASEMFTPASPAELARAGVEGATPAEITAAEVGAARGGLSDTLQVAAPETKDTLIRTAVAQSAEGRPVDVADIARLDPALRAEEVRATDNALEERAAELVRERDLSLQDALEQASIELGDRARGDWQALRAAREQPIPQQAWSDFVEKQRAQSAPAERPPIEKAPIVSKTAEAEVAALRQEANDATQSTASLASTIQGGKTAKAQKPTNAYRFVMGLGGVKDITGELKALGLHKQVIGLIRNKGLHPDYAREALAEAGYFHGFGSNADAVAKTTLADFYDLMARGKDAFAHEDMAAAEAHGRAGKVEAQDAILHQEIAEHVSHYGIVLDDPMTERAAQLVRDGLTVEDAVERASIEKVDALVPDARHGLVDEIPGFTESHIQGLPDRGGQAAQGSPASRGSGSGGRAGGGQDIGRAGPNEGQPGTASPNSLKGKVDAATQTVTDAAKALGLDENNPIIAEMNAADHTVEAANFGQAAKAMAGCLLRRGAE